MSLFGSRTRSKVARAATAVAVGAALTSAPVAGAAPTASAGESKALYDVSFMGLGIAKGSLAVKVDRGAYAAKLHISTSGLARIISSEESIATAKGRIGRGLTPAAYELMSRGDKVTQVSMGLGGGSIKSLRAIPELMERDDRVPVTSAHKRNVMDPLSAVLLPIPAKSKDGVGREVCDRTLPIFDGWTRYDIKLSYKATERVNVPGYAGDAIVCGARWVPVAGHREGKESTRFMQNNKDLEAWFVPSEDGAIALPYKIAVRTMRGMLVVQARQFGDGSSMTKASN
ncbi:DUF3108 domain-containing protein [Chthonobacter rhizosphaerae]|uniref:DUF3108 domain-containing protein n=1 Tax=Chthonobacter rhizosphaerae TaxID=2735553 RepID=UPI0015EFB87C